jgi:ABC-type proline/glycine betaine transport system substrate-binding protein
MKRTLQLTLLTLLTFALILTGCGQGNNNEPAANDTNNTPSAAPENKEISLAYVAWDSEIASTNVVKHVLENNLNYEVEMLQVDAGPMWAGVSGGSADAMVAAWLPSTHESYYTDNEGDFIDLGPNLDGTKIGLVVPAYMDITTIEDLKTSDIGAEVDYTIVGIEPGAGLMMATNEVITEYGLDEWTLLESSSAAMATELRSAYEEERPVIVTGWTPHWKFAEFDLKYLEDSLSIYGGAEQIHTIVRQGLEDTHPAAYTFLDNFNWSADDMAAVMVDIQSGTSPEDAAAAWAAANEAKVNEWIEGIE